MSSRAYPAKAGRPRRATDPNIPSSQSQRPGPAPRIIVCDYNQLLQSVTGLLRMSGYAVFQAYDGLATAELCAQLPNIRLVVLNTYGTGTDLGDLIDSVRRVQPRMPVLHIGNTVPASLPADVPTLMEDFTPDDLLRSVEALIDESGPWAEGPNRTRQVFPSHRCDAAMIRSEGATE